jgi:hypothetical protein
MLAGEVIQKSRDRSYQMDVLLACLDVCSRRWHIRGCLRSRVPYEETQLTSACKAAHTCTQEPHQSELGLEVRQVVQQGGATPCHRSHSHLTSRASQSPASFSRQVQSSNLRQQCLVTALLLVGGWGIGPLTIPSALIPFLDPLMTGS